MSDVCHIRRVSAPDPMREELARQAVDAVLRATPAGTKVRFLSLVLAADEYGVALGYILDECERRVRTRAEASTS
jgi:hypothetical protein